MMTNCERLRRISVCCLLLTACASPVPQIDIKTRPTRATFDVLIDLTSAEGEKMLYGSNAKRDFLPLSIHFVSQQNLAYCGVASMTMVLNALGLPAPIDPVYKRFPMFTQNNVFNPITEQILGASVIARQGMTLDQLGALLASYPTEVRVFHAANSSLAEFRNIAVENLRQADNFVLVNYLRKAIGQESGGHISPVAAYDEKSDRFLILDVARFKYPPIWISAEILWNAMRTIDDASGKTRGYVTVAKNARVDLNR